MKKFAILLAVIGALAFASVAGATVKPWCPPYYPTPAPQSTGQIDRSGTCVNGVFTDLTTDQFAYGSGLLAGAVISSANWVQGLGETCDNPAALGYVAAGYNVSDAGTVDTAAPQFNVYPFWVKA